MTGWDQFYLLYFSKHVKSSVLQSTEEITQNCFLACHSKSLSADTLT